MRVLPYEHQRAPLLSTPPLTAPPPMVVPPKPGLCPHSAVCTLDHATQSSRVTLSSLAGPLLPLRCPRACPPAYPMPPGPLALLIPPLLSSSCSPERLPWWSQSTHPGLGCPSLPRPLQACNEIGNLAQGGRSPVRQRALMAASRGSLQSAPPGAKVALRPDGAGAWALQVVVCTPREIHVQLP